MKKSIVLLMLLTGITVNLCAQKSNADNVFELPAHIIMNRRFMVNLDKGNTMQLELTDITDLKSISNIDSLLQNFLADIADLKDSLADPLTAKRIDYITDAQGRKKIRFRQFQPAGASFLINKGELASLRTEQDSIHIIGFIASPALPEDRVSSIKERCYHVTFYLNDHKELKRYLDAGILKEKITLLQNNYNGKWTRSKSTGMQSLSADNSITADWQRGNTGSGGDYLELHGMVNIQNYKNYFVPSFSVGARLTLTNRLRTFKWEPGLYWEPHFIFAKDSLGKLNTYRNDFLTLTFTQGGIRENDSRKEFSFSTSFSLGYLIRRQGEFFEKHTFRFGGGKIKLHKTSIEPSLYFNDFFKGVTPGIRITQHF